MSVSSPTILLVEDNDDDVFAMQRALRKAQITHRVEVVPDGQRAIDYLSGSGAYADRESCPLPTLMFLDLKLPYVSGFEVLAWLRQHPELRDLTVVVLTGSGEQSDRDRAAQLGAWTYLVKPPDPLELTRLIGEIR